METDERRLLALLDAKKLFYRVEYADVGNVGNVGNLNIAADWIAGSASLPLLMAGPLSFSYDALQELEDAGRFDGIFKQVPSVGESVSHPAIS
jgi:hypothetical protein